MKKEDWQGILNALSLLTQLGIVMVVNIGAGFFLGNLLDNFLELQYMFKIIGILTGVGSGFYSNYKLIDKFMDNGENDNNK